MDNTLKQILQDYVDVSHALHEAQEQLRLLQAEFTDLKNKNEARVASANKGI